MQEPHFRHLPNEGAPECDQYYPGFGDRDESVVAAAGSTAEEDPSELALLLTQQDGRWGLGLQVPEIPAEELGDISLSELKHARVDLIVGSTRKGSIRALDLRPGVGAACIDVLPCLQILRTSPNGRWPPSIDLERWKLESRELEAKGVLFRLRGGEWTRLRANSGVQYGETLLILAEERCAIPTSIIAEPLGKIQNDGLVWLISELRFPSGRVPGVENWVTRLGHAMIRRPWRLELLTSPRYFSERGEPVFWVDDCAVAQLHAPEPADEAIVALHSGTNVHSISVKAGSNAAVDISILMRSAGTARLIVPGVRDLKLDLGFVTRPSFASRISEAANTAQRLRIQIGSLRFDAWSSASHKVPVPAGELPEPLVSLGDDTNRASVTFWERGKQQTVRGLDSRGAAKVLGDVLRSAERVEVDAGNLGRIAMALERESVNYSNAQGDFDRLAWWNHIVSLSALPERHLTYAVLERPRGIRSLVVQPVDRAALIRSRMSLRRHLRVRGD